MLRSSRHILKFQTKSKTILLNKMFDSYKYLVQNYINLIWNHKLELKLLMSSNELPNSREIKHSRWKQVAYKQASEMVRSVINKNKNSKTKLTCPILKNISINLDERLFDMNKSSIQFDEFINIKLPFFHENKKRAIQVKIPLKYHEHSLKFKDWDRKKSVKLTRKNNKFNAILTYEIETPKLKNNGKELGLDLGYNKLITTSDGEIIGTEMKQLYSKISNKKQNSKSFKRSLKERDNKTNYFCNRLNISSIKVLIVENLLNLKQNSSLHREVMNKVQRWSYLNTLDKLDRMCEENGVLFTRINPAWTSQECSSCGTTDKLNREGEIYSCNHCKIEMDADLNAAINILRRGIYSSSIKKDDFKLFKKQ